MSKLALSASLACVAGMAASVHGDSISSLSKPDPAVVIGIADSFCSIQNGLNANQKPHFQIAAAKNELTPFGKLPSGDDAKAVASDAPPLWNNLGSLTYPVTTKKPLAQKYFDQGLRLNYGFNHEEALRSFRAAQQIDPECAMCYWGEALVLGPNINMPMDPEENRPAVAAVKKAKSLSSKAKPHERALIQALDTRYSNRPEADRKKLDIAYANAMDKVSKQYPDDPEIGTLYAEALMNLSPWDYWEANGTKAKGRTPELVATLKGVLDHYPDHPGAIHYYIHTIEASANPKKAEPYADRLGALMPGAGHLVHMPSHIYYRVGRYKDSLSVNRQAVAVDEAYIAENKPVGIYPVAYYPHNVHFVLVSAQMAGDGKTVIGAANKLSGLITDKAAREFAIAQPVRVAPYFAHAQFSDPNIILALPAPQPGLPFVEGMWNYARGVAYVKSGDADNARQSVSAIEKMRSMGDFEELTEAGIPAKEVLQIASLVLQGRIAQDSGDFNAAVKHFEQAVLIQDQLAYMEPSYWYYPVRQSLGAALLQKGDLAGAEQAFRASLIRVPNNGWALYGLSEVYKRRGNAAELSATEDLLSRTWIGDKKQLSIGKL